MPGFSVNVVKLPDGDLLHIPNIKLDLLPGGWDSVRIELISDSQHPFHKDQVEQITLRVFSEYDRQDHLFLVNFQPNK